MTAGSGRGFCFGHGFGREVVRAEGVEAEQVPGQEELGDVPPAVLVDPDGAVLRVQLPVIERPTSRSEWAWHAIQVRLPGHVPADTLVRTISGAAPRTQSLLVRASNARPVRFAMPAPVT